MHYYIDGYNLLFKIVSAGEDLQKQRTRLIQDLRSKIEILKLDAVLVFDSHYQPSASTRLHYNDFEVVFTDEGETADDYILSKLKSSPNPAQETVVTSDKRLAWRARRKLAKTESVEEFISWLNKRVKNKLQPKEKPCEKLSKITSTPIPQSQKEFPKSRASAEECFDYYLETFEQADAKQIPIKKNGKPLKKIDQPIEKQKEVISEFERWLKIFENPS